MNPFSHDVERCASAAKNAQMLGVIGSIVSFGLWRNLRGIRATKTDLDRATKDFQELEQLLPNNAEFFKQQAPLSSVRIDNNLIPLTNNDGTTSYGPDWDTISESIKHRDGHLCQHADGRCAGPLQVHHIRHIADGGTNDPSNLTTLCKFHHGLQHPDNPRFK